MTADELRTELRELIEDELDLRATPQGKRIIVETDDGLLIVLVAAAKTIDGFEPYPPTG